MTSFVSRYRSRIVAILLALLAWMAVVVPAQAQVVNSSCRLAQPNSLGQHVAEICWFQFGNSGDFLASGSTRDYDFSLPDGSRVTMTIAVSGGTHAAPGLGVTQAPTWTGSNFSGSSNYYKILTPNSAALYASGGIANGVVMTASDIRLFRPDGSEVTDVPFEVIFADSERLNNNPERMDFGVTSGGSAFTILEWLGPGGAGYNVTSGTPGTVDSGVASACWSGSAPIGVDCRRFKGTSGSSDASAVVLSTRRDTASSAPFTVMGQVYSSGGQGFAIGVRWGSVRLRKALPNGRIATADQFSYRLRNIAGNVVAESTTTAATTNTTPSPWISTTAMPGNVITIEEAMAAGSTSVLGQYSSWVRCEGGAGGASSVIIDQAYSAANPPQIHLDSSVNVPGYNIDCEITNRPAQYNLRVQKALVEVNGAAYIAGQPVLPGDTLRYVITVQNVGAAQAILPAGSVVESLPEGTTLNAATTAFTCYLNTCSNTAAQTINAGASATLDFVVDVDAPFTESPRQVSNTIAVSGVDCASAGNACGVDVPVNEVADLTVTKTNGVNSLVSGSTTTYTITAVNNGPGSATGAVVKDAPTSGLDCPLANAVTCAGSGCPSGSYTMQDLIDGIALGTLAPAPPGNTVTLTYTCNVP